MHEETQIYKGVERETQATAQCLVELEGGKEKKAPPASHTAELTPRHGTR
jgi:hypothetical protein